MLKADVAGEHRMPSTGDVPGGEDSGRARSQMVVGDYTVFECQPGTFGDLDPRSDTYAHNKNVAPQ